MNAIEFNNTWTEFEDNLNPISIKRLDDLKLSELTIEFLTKSGLPDDSAPYLSFAKDSNDIYDGINRLTKVYDFLEHEFDKYIVIGSCNDGDPIVINTEKNDRIEHLDHEDIFSSKNFNTNINSLAQSLIAYRNFVINVQLENGEDAYLDSNFSDEQFNKLKTDLTEADSMTNDENSFWSEQLKMELELRKENRNQK